MTAHNHTSPHPRPPAPTSRTVKPPPMPIDAEVFLAECAGVPADVIGARVLARCWAWNGGHVDQSWVARAAGMDYDRVVDHWRTITDGLAEVVAARVRADKRAKSYSDHAAKAAAGRWALLRIDGDHAPGIGGNHAPSMSGDAPGISKHAPGIRDGPPRVPIENAPSMTANAPSIKNHAPSMAARKVRGGGEGGEVLPTRPETNSSASKRAPEAWELIASNSGEVGRMSVRTLLAGLGVEEPSLSQLVTARLEREAVVTEARGVLASKGVTSRAAVLVTRLRKAHGLESLKARPMAADVAAAVSGIAKVKENRRTKR